MKNFKKLLAVIIVFVLICLQIPMGVFATDGIEWSDTNLVEGQGNITLNDYTWDWLGADLKADASYKYNFNLVTTTTEGYLLPTVAVRDYSANSDGTEGVYVVFNVASNQIRIGYEYTTNSSLLAVATASDFGIVAGGTYAVEIISTPTTVEVIVDGAPIQFCEFTDFQYRSTITVSGLKDGKAGFNAQGSVLDTQVTDIAVYGEEGVDVGGEGAEDEESVWSDTNLVEGQGSLTLDYFWKWMPTTIKSDASYKYNFNIQATDTAGYRFPTVAVRDVSAGSDGTDGLYVVFNNADDQIRIGYEYTTNSSLIAVATGVGFSPAGTYEVEIITTPTTIEVYMNGNQISFYDFNLGQYNVTTITTKEFADAKAGFITQGNVLDTQITDIAIYGEKAAEEEETARWSETNMVDGQADITLNDYFWDWIPGHIYADASYKYNFNLVTTTTEGYLLPTVAVRDYSAASDGTEGVYVVFNLALDQIRIGYEYTTNSSLIAVATASAYGVTAGGTYAVEIITTPTTIEVFVNGSPVAFTDMLDNYQSKNAIPVSGLKDGIAGFNAQGNVLDAQVTDIAIYTEAGKEQVDPIVFSVNNAEAFVGDEFEVVVSVDSNPGIVSAVLNVEYDSDVFELVGVNDGEFDSTIESAGEAFNCYNYSEITANPFVINWVNPLLTEDTTKTGTFAVLTFRVKENAVEGDYNINIVPDNDGNIFDVQLNDVPAESVVATITVKGDLAGDVNNDRNVDNKDLVLMMRYINGWNVEINVEAADVYANGIISNRDYVLLLRYINGWDVLIG